MKYWRKAGQLTTSCEIKLALGNTDSVLSNDETKNRINQANNLYNSIYISQYTELKRSEDVGGTCVGRWERHGQGSGGGHDMGEEVGRIMQDTGEEVGRTWAKRWCVRTWERLGWGHDVGKDVGRTQAWVRRVG